MRNWIYFLSILTGIFFVIYRQSDKKGFRRLWTSFKTAIIFSAIIAGLIPTNSEAIEPTGNNNQQVVLVKADGHGHSITPPTNRGPSNFPIPPLPSRGRPSYGTVPNLRAPIKIASANKESGKFISFWKLDKPGQLEKFLINDNVI